MNRRLPIRASSLISIGAMCAAVTLADEPEVFKTKSLSFARALERANKRWQLVRYEYAEHDILQDRYRTDLLARLGEFLDEHTSK
jgi:dipeptidyl aminopeptidase/acylaminoacyl peptidase